MLDCRKFYKSMMEKVPTDEILQSQELIPGGDIRVKGNLWLRAAYTSAGLSKVPRETQVRLAVNKLVHKKKLCSLLSVLMPLKLEWDMIGAFQTLPKQQSQAKARALRKMLGMSGCGSRLPVESLPFPLPCRRTDATRFC